jgi:hypothetical protein
MKKIKILCDWDLDVNIESDKNIELWVDQNPNLEKDPDVIRIGLLIEPEEIRRSLGLVTFLDRFDYILTHNKDIIVSRENSFLYEFGGCWVKDYEFGNKEFGVSTLIGGKNLAQGHELRKNLFERHDEIQIPKNIWVSKNFPPANPGNHQLLTGTKSSMFNRQFHIVIENVKRENWFTEKLLDALYTKTIPIYYGCPNIGDWFDTEGFIMVDNVNEIIKACNSLTADSYNNMIDAVERNYIECQKYLDVGENIKRSIEKNVLTLM